MRLPTLPTLRSLLGLDALEERLIARINSTASSLTSSIDGVYQLVARPHAPFVSVLITGQMLLDATPSLRGSVGELRPHLEPGRVEPVTLGMCGEVPSNGTQLCLETTAQRPIGQATVIVFADLRRVRLSGVFCGVDLQFASVDAMDAPIAHLSRTWEPGVKLRVMCEARRVYTPPEVRGPFHAPPPHS